MNFDNKYSNLVNSPCLTKKHIYFVQDNTFPDMYMPKHEETFLLFLCNVFQFLWKQQCKLLLFHKAVSVHGPSYWSSLLSAKEEDEYRSSRKSEILGWSKRGTGDLKKLRNSRIKLRKSDTRKAKIILNHLFSKKSRKQLLACKYIKEVKIVLDKVPDFLIHIMVQDRDI